MGRAHTLKIMDFEKALGLWFRGNGANRKRLCRMKRITPRCSGVKRTTPRFFCPLAKTLGMRGLFGVKARICYAGSKPGPMHRPPSNLVRSEEAAIRRRVECRGKPGPFSAWGGKWAELASREGCGCALPSRVGTGLRTKRGPALQAPQEPASRPAKARTWQARPIFRLRKKMGHSCQPIGLRTKRSHPERCQAPAAISPEQRPPRVIQQ